ncbi:hypothetical protein K525DRAFT_153413, partial [Schizophyllum commune Loenen D]
IYIVSHLPFVLVLSFAMSFSSPAPHLSSFGQEEDGPYLSSLPVIDLPPPSSRAHSPIESVLFFNYEAPASAVFSPFAPLFPEEPSTTAVPTATVAAVTDYDDVDADKENDPPPAGLYYDRPSLPRLGEIAVTYSQVTEFRQAYAFAQGRDLSIPEKVLGHIIFLDEFFERDLIFWGTRALQFWYMYDPSRALERPPNRWWNLVGKAYRDFTRLHAIPSFAPPTKLLEYFPLPILPNPHFDVGPRPVRGSDIITELLTNLTPRDLAYATAGSTITPVDGHTYTFLDFFPELLQEFTLADACRANGMSAERTAFFMGAVPPVVAPDTPPMCDFRELTASPDLPQWVGIELDSFDFDSFYSPASSPSVPDTPARSEWGSSSTALDSSPPPSEFDSEFDTELGTDFSEGYSSDVAPPPNWKTGQILPGPMGRAHKPRRYRAHRHHRAARHAPPCWTRLLIAPAAQPYLPSLTSKSPMASHKPGARPRDKGFAHDFDLRTDMNAMPRHVSFSLSRDGRRVASHAETFHRPIAQKKKKVEDLVATHSEWCPVEGSDEPDVAYDYPTLEEDDPEVIQCEAGEKRKRQTDPTHTWQEFSQQAFLNEMMWGEGLRDALPDLSCTSCSAAYVPPSTSGAYDPTLTRIFCCWSCGDFNECLDCCVKRHELMPLHVLEEWTGQYWSKVSLASLGFVYQLGHGGRPCIHPEPLIRTIAVLDRSIHTLRVRYCGCRFGPTTEHTVQLLRNRWYPATSVDPETCATFACLDQLRLAAVHANTNTHGFIKMLEAETDPIGLTKVPRAGSANSLAGIAGTPIGGLVVRCWACPREGVNLPPGWDQVNEKEKYRFQVMLALDANFRLKNRIRKNESDVGALGEGLGYFVATEPYKNHLRNYIKENDISSCIAFAALAEKDTKVTKGLRVSGVGGVICARHELIQPHGFADLQKGERYCNMDYVLCSVLRQLNSAHTTCSYDIGCQYMTNFYERTMKLPRHLRPDPSADLKFCLPVWHGAIHEESCRSVNSLKYHHGVGRTDGEGIERIWSILNSISYATKEMGEGTRHDAIEDKSDSINFGKNISQLPTLLRRLVIALDEREVQIAAFKRVNKNVDKKLVSKWKKEVSDWRQDASGQSPFAMPEGQGVSEAEVRRMLDAEELEEAKKGRAGVHTTSQTAFLSAGLQLENAQRRIMADIQGPAVLPMNLEGLITSRRRAFLSKKDNFEQLQKVYMPGAQVHIEASESGIQGAVEAEQQKLYLPSDLPASLRRSACAEGLPEKELKLRRGQARDALYNLRRKLHAKQYHIEFRNKNTTGQKKSTRARALLTTLQEKIELDAAAYRKARHAILSLRGVALDDEFPPLLAADLQLEGEESESDAAAMAAMARAGASGRPRQTHVSSGKHKMSWIWTAKGAPSAKDEANVLETVRCLWAKALARKDRWVEEVVILQEDMRRCLRSLEWEADKWRERASVNIGQGDAYFSGTRAYALRQVAQWTALRDHFKSGWSKPVGRAKRMVFEEQAHRGVLDSDLASSIIAAGA